MMFNFIRYIIISSIITTSLQDCLISIRDDLDDRTPLLLKPQKWQAFAYFPFYEPEEENGIIKLSYNQKLMLHCPGTELEANDDIYKTGMLQVSCRNNKNFGIVGTAKVYHFSSFKCVDRLQSTVRRLNKKCPGNNELLEIGFRLNNDEFITQISVCFNCTLLHTHYVEYYMSKYIDKAEFGVRRPGFQEGGNFFNLDKDVEDCYNMGKQQRHLNRILNRPSNSRDIINGNTFFTRGHLAAKQDFLYAGQQRATFYFVNAAPQSKGLNNGNWNDLEIDVRNFVSHSRRQMLIYTGTMGILEYNSVNLFLHVDEEGAGHIPVPKFYWKVVYDPESKKGLAVIGSNDPFGYSVEPFCKDICYKIDWFLKLHRLEHKFGIYFCCTVDELRRFRSHSVCDACALALQSCALYRLLSKTTPSIQKIEHAGDMDDLSDTPPPDVFADTLEGVTMREKAASKRINPKHHNNNYAADYMPVNTQYSGPRGRKTFAFWTLVCLLFILAVGNLILTMTILGVLKLGQGMESLELLPQYSAVKLYGNTDLNDIYKRDGILESYTEKPMEISGIQSSVILKLSKQGRPIHKLIMNKNGTLIRHTNVFEVKNDKDQLVFTTNEPTFNVQRPMSNLATKLVQTNRIVAPFGEDLQMEGKNVHLRGSEGTTMESRDLVITADRDIYVKSLNGSIILVGKDGVRLDYKKLPIFMPKANDKLTMQYKVCVCMPKGKLFKVPVTRDDGRVYCDRINLQQFNPCI